MLTMRQRWGVVLSAAAAAAVVGTAVYAAESTQPTMQSREPLDLEHVPVWSATTPDHLVHNADGSVYTVNLNEPDPTPPPDDTP
jgi:hypothetical protein